MSREFSENKYQQLLGEECLKASPEHFDVVWRLMAAQFHSNPGFLTWKNIDTILGVKKEWGKKESEDLSVLSYWQGFQWMCEKLKEHHIPFNIQQLDMYSKMKRYDLDTNSEKAIAHETMLKETEFFLEFEGQTWSPSVGFMFLEEICSKRININFEKNYTFKKVNPTVLWEMLGLDCASPEDLEKIDAKVAKSFDEQWNMCSPSEDQDDLFLVSHNDGFVDTCFVVQAPSNYAAPNDTFEVCHENQFLIQKLADLPRVPPEKLKKAIGLKDANFPKTAELPKNRVQEEMKIAKQWYDAFTKAWHNLVDLQTEQGSEVIFLKAKQNNGGPEIASLFLDLGSQQTIENLYRLLVLKNKPLNLLSQENAIDCLGLFTDVLSVDGLSVVIPSFSTSWNLNLVKMLKEAPDYQFTVFDTGPENQNVKELLTRWSLEYQLKQEVKPLANPPVFPEPPKFGRF